MKKVVTFGILGLLLVVLVAGAYAFGFGNQDANKALEAGDYTAWKAAMTAGLTEQRFNQVRVRYNQMVEKRAEMEATKTKIEAAMQQGYDAWKEAISDSPRGDYIIEVITEDNFDSYVKMYEARKAGDFETAKQIADELGLKCEMHGFRGVF
jgi:hypothetical protein